MTYLKAVEAGCDMNRYSYVTYGSWVQASLQQRFSLRHSRELLMIPDFDQEPSR